MRFFVYSNLFVSLCATGLTLLSYVLIEAAPNLVVAGFVFASTLAVYNADRLFAGSEHDRSQRHKWIASHRPLLWGASVIACASLLALLPLLPKAVMYMVFPLAAISSLYFFPVLPGPSGLRRLKDVAGVKTFVVAMVWALVTVGLPLADVGQMELALLGERAFFIFAITLPFEIRDLERDRAAGVLSIPHILGVPRTKGLAILLLLLFAGSALFHYSNPMHAMALALSGVLTIPLIGATHVDRGDFFYSVLMDGTMLIQVGLVMVVS